MYSIIELSTTQNTGLNRIPVFTRPCRSVPLTWMKGMSILGNISIEITLRVIFGKV